MKRLENGLKVGLFLNFLKAESQISIPFILTPKPKALSPILRPFSSRVILFLFRSQRVAILKPFGIHQRIVLEDMLYFFQKPWCNIRSAVLITLIPGWISRHGIPQYL